MDKLISNQLILALNSINPKLTEFRRTGTPTLFKELEELLFNTACILSSPQHYCDILDCDDNKTGFNRDCVILEKYEGLITELNERIVDFLAAMRAHKSDKNYKIDDDVCNGLVDALFSLRTAIGKNVRSLTNILDSGESLKFSEELSNIQAYKDDIIQCLEYFIESIDAELERAKKTPVYIEKLESYKEKLENLLGNFEEFNWFDELDSYNEFSGDYDDLLEELHNINDATVNNGLLSW